MINIRKSNIGNRVFVFRACFLVNIFIYVWKGDIIDLYKMVKYIFFYERIFIVVYDFVCCFVIFLFNKVF